MIGLAVHALLDRAFPHRDRILLAYRNTTGMVDLSGIDPDQATLADLATFCAQAPEASPGVGGHLIVIDGGASAAATTDPDTRLEFDTCDSAVRMTTELGVDEQELIDVVNLVWPLLAAADPDVPLQQIVSSAAAQILSTRTSAPYGDPPLFLTRFLDLVRRHPHRIAVETADHAITYQELNAVADTIASTLEAHGAGPGRVVLLIPRRDEYLVAMMVATFKVGSALAITNPTAPQAFLRECINAARADLVVDLAGIGFPDALSEVPTTPQHGQRYDSERLSGDDCAVVTFTSGTSGTPKAVRGRYRSLTYYFDWMDEHLGLLADARFGMCSALGHDPLQRDVMTPLYLGTTVVVPPEAELTSHGGLARWLAETDTQVACVNPSAIALLTAADRQLPALRVVFLVGAALTRPQVQSLARIAPSARLVALYGSTETQRAVAFFDIDTSAEAIEKLPDVIPSGRGMADVDVLVLTGAGSVCLPWQSGQIGVRSPQIALGYAGDPEMTAAKFRIGLPTGTPPHDHTPTYLTGDIGYSTPRHGVHYLGRADAQVKINGHRIELDHVTAKARATAAVRDAAAIVADVAGAPALALFLVPENPAIRFEATAFRALLAEQLPSHMLPTRVITLHELPITRNQKVDTTALARHLAPPAQDEVDQRRDGQAAHLVRNYLYRLTGDTDPDPSIPLRELGVDSLRLAALLSQLPGPASGAHAATTALTAAQLVDAVSVGLDAPEVPDDDLSGDQGRYRGQGGRARG
ncbi:AMP-binding protein, partial [Nocardia sp. NPDC058497]|uniref:AMP-binding protein n=1 Tax=Nocardia sp. NPDC058497 TaxID=3346529 RepID=UPI00364DB188